MDGQTTNPSLIAKNPEVKKLIASGHTLNEDEENLEYRKIVQSISPLVGSAGVSIEVFADLDTSADQMLTVEDTVGHKGSFKGGVLSFGYPVQMLSPWAG